MKMRCMFPRMVSNRRQYVSGNIELYFLLSRVMYSLALMSPPHPDITVYSLDYFCCSSSLNYKYLTCLIEKVQE